MLAIIKKTEGTLSSAILCDLCGRAKECFQKEIDGKEYDICGDCWNPWAEKTKRKGPGKEGAGSRVLAAADEGTRAATTEASARRAAEDLG
jgi:hypothetical protein